VVGSATGGHQRFAGRRNSQLQNGSLIDVNWIRRVESGILNATVPNHRTVTKDLFLNGDFTFHSKLARSGFKT
jgi:hypothetical protein